MIAPHCPAPRVLIADDEPVSLHFLEAALAQSGCEVVAVADGASTLAATQAQSFDLLLLDRRMPDIGGMALLAALRHQGVETRAIATSADVDSAIVAQLHAAGFVAIIEKPLMIERLLDIVRPHVRIRANASAHSDVKFVAPLLDDALGLASIGDAETLRALRVLLARELVDLQRDLDTSAPFTETGQWADRMHRLRASCGFCGATALARAAQELEQALHTPAAMQQHLLVDFIHICRSTLAELG